MAPRSKSQKPKEKGSSKTKKRAVRIVKRSKTKNRRSLASRMKMKKPRPVRVSASGIDVTRMKEPSNMKGIKFDTYIRKLQRKVSPDNNLSADSMKVLNCWMKAMLHRIAAEVSNKMGRRKVIKPKIINKAMKRIVPHKIRQELNKRGLMAVDRYKKSMQKRRR